MPHPAVTRQAVRQASNGETTNLPAAVFYSHDPTKTGVSAYGAPRKSISIHTEGAAGANAGVNQIATQDPDVAQALLDASKTGLVTKIGALI